MWRAKWGDEVHTEAFAARLAWAAGYFAEVTYFVPSGRSTVRTPCSARRVHRRRRRFRNARFELDEPGVVKHFDEHSWAWNENPFVGTRELKGLKIVMMLLSNWDNKDVRDVARGSNTAIFEYEVGRNVREARYLIIDWGAALGTWGSNVLSRGRWDCQAFTAQTISSFSVWTATWCNGATRVNARLMPDRHHARGRAMAVQICRETQ